MSIFDDVATFLVETFTEEGQQAVVNTTVAEGEALGEVLDLRNLGPAAVDYFTQLLTGTDTQAIETERQAQQYTNQQTAIGQLTNAISAVWAGTLLRDALVTGAALLAVYMLIRALNGRDRERR